MKLITPLFKKPYIELENEQERELFNLDKDKEIERLKEDISNYVKITLHDRKEIDRLNNIINELEKYINEEYIYDELGMKIFDASELQDKLQELKGSDKE